MTVMKLSATGYVIETWVLLVFIHFQPYYLYPNILSHIALFVNMEFWLMTFLHLFLKIRKSISFFLFFFFFRSSL